MITWAILLCVFLSVLCVFMFVATQATNLVNFSRQSGLLDNSDVMKLPMGWLIAATAVLFSGTRWRSIVASTKERLIAAGNPGGAITGEQFIAILLLISLGLWLFNFFMLFAISNFSPIVIIFPTLVAVLSFVLGNMWLNSLAVDRKKMLVRDFPYFIDQTVMVMGAGSTFPQAVKIYIRENPTGPLTSELVSVSGEIDYGKPLVEALSDMESRIETVGVKNALRSLIQGLKMGTPIIDSLEEQADAMRFMRSQVAERVAEEMKIKMQGPAMLLLVSVLILVLGPAAVNMQNNGVF